jgi:membrane protein
MRSPDPGPMRVFGRLLHGALLGSFHDNALSTAKAATYSLLLSIFPALLLVANALAGTTVLQAVMAEFAPVLSRVLPSPVLRLVNSSLTGVAHATPHVAISAALVAVWTGSSAAISWMEGFQAAYKAPPFPLVKGRLIALLLATVSVIPLMIATLLISLGGGAEVWLARHYGLLNRPILLLWDVTRWLIAILTTSLILSVIYHRGLNRHVTWASVFPGAVVATFLWLISTAFFALYVRHYADYSSIYGSLAQVVILMVWLYILSLAVLTGAEFNSELELHRYSRTQAQETPAE